MRSVSVSELKCRIGQILRVAREQREMVEITYRGQVIALLVPSEPTQPNLEELDTFWADLERLSAEISAHWPEGVSAADAVSEQRREL